MSNFQIQQTPIEGLVIVEPRVFGDDRGFFMETFVQRDFEALGICGPFVQDNHSRSCRGVLRGLHFQTQSPQGKLVRVVAGAVYDVAVDLRPGSPTYGRWCAVELTARNKKQFYIPPGFAHGFLSLEDGTELLYKCTDYYRPEYDAGLRWNDPQVAVDWKLEEYGLTEADLLLSEKDGRQPLLHQL